MTDFPAWSAEDRKRYKEAGCWRGETFPAMLQERAERFGKRVALTSGDSRMTYSELNQRAESLAGGLHRRGIKAGDRVVVQLPNIPAFLEVIFALFRLGALPVFALPLHRYQEISHLCRFAGATAYIIVNTGSGFDYEALARQVLEEASELQVLVAGPSQSFPELDRLQLEPVPASVPLPMPGDVAFLQLSGGSTGLPKLIPRTHDDYIYSLRRSAEICRLDESSVYLTALPMAHNYPLSSPGVLGTLYAGGRVVLTGQAAPEQIFTLIRKEKVTITGVVPPLALVWLEAAQARRPELPSLQVLQVGGAKFAAEAAKRVSAVLGCTLQQVFGMAEGLVNYTRLDDLEEVIVHTQGRPMSPFDRIRVVDDEDGEVAPGEVGHLLTKGPYTIPGYYNAEEHNRFAFTEDGYYRTGDLVRLTPEGNLVVEGRAKDQINRGGDKIAAEEVENHLLAHPHIHDAAMVSMPDDYLGERSCAFLVAAGEAPKEQEVKAFLRSRGLAGYKIPDRIEFVPELPKTSVGKISKKALRELLAARRTAGSAAGRLP
jgi:2,3-dihydroxybenzoate-AMP ligase